MKKLGILAAGFVFVSMSAHAQTACKIETIGEDIFVTCADGSYFHGPASGGMAAGADRRGNPLYAVISIAAGKYSIDVLPR